MTFKDQLVAACNKGVADMGTLFMDTLRDFCRVYEELGYKAEINWSNGLTLRKDFAVQQGIITWQFSGKSVTLHGGGYVQEKVTTDDPEVVKKTILDWVSRRLVCV